MVTVLYRQRHGYDVRIYTNDHPPPHAHVHKGGKDLQINLNTLEISFNRGFNTREIRQIRNLVKDNRKLLQDLWQDLHDWRGRPL